LENLRQGCAGGGFDRCLRGIIGLMGESDHRNRAGLLQVLATLDPTREACESMPWWAVEGTTGQQERSIPLSWCGWLATASRC